MADLGTLRVTLIANLRKFSSQMQAGVGQVKRFSTAVIAGMRRAGNAIKSFTLNAARRLGAFAKKWVRRAILALTALGIAAIKWAADAEESENLVAESFGNMTDSVNKWSDNLQETLGLDAIELRKQAGFFNLLTVSMGLSEGQAFRLSTTLTELTADMASFRNQSFKEIFNAMRSGITGMTRPLQNLGINIKETAVDELLLREGIDATSASLTEQSKILARYITILEATGKDMGDLDRTYDSFTNVMRVMVTNAKILARELGGPLMAAITPLAITMRDWLFSSREDIVAWFTVAMEKFRAFAFFFQQADWNTRIQTALDLTIEIFKVFSDAAIAIFTDMFSNIGMTIVNSMRKSIALAITRVNLMDEIFAEQGISFADRLASALTNRRLGHTSKQQTAVFDEATRRIKKLEESGGLAGLFDSPKVNTAWDAFSSRLDVLKAKIAAITAQGKQALAASAEELAAAQAKRDGEFEIRQAERIKKRDEEIRVALAKLKSNVEEAKALVEPAQEAMAELASSWAAMWEDAAGAMAGAMRTAWADMILQAKSGTEIISALVQKMARSIIEAAFTAFIQPGVSQIFGAIAGTGIGPQRAPATRNAEFFSRGGVVQPVYAASGFTARGTDTVPAMLTPGEMVIPKEIVDAIGGRSPAVHINVNAIDAQGTAQWLNKNKRLIAGMIGETRMANNPSARRLGR